MGLYRVENKSVTPILRWARPSRHVRFARMDISYRSELDGGGTEIGQQFHRFSQIASAGLRARRTMQAGPWQEPAGEPVRGLPGWPIVGAPGDEIGADQGRSLRISAVVSKLRLLMQARWLELPLSIGTAFAAAACLTLAACSTSEPIPPVVYVPPSMPIPTALVAAVKQAAAVAHLAAPLEMSDLRPTDHGPGHFVVCIRGVSNDSRTGFYAVFFDNNAYMGLRLPTILDGCENQSYHPVP
jgi:hypothetical protein